MTPVRLWVNFGKVLFLERERGVFPRVEPRRPAPYAPGQAQQDPAASVFQEGAGGRIYRSPCILGASHAKDGSWRAHFSRPPGVAASGLAASIVRWLSFISGLRPFAVFGVLTLGLLKKKLDGIF